LQAEGLHRRQRLGTGAGLEDAVVAAVVLPQIALHRVEHLRLIIDRHG
jgi:hypothetical protein